MKVQSLRKPAFWIGGFFAFHCLAIFLCQFPGSSPVRQALAKPFWGYIRMFKMGQNWAMFAPEPSRMNAFVRAEVKFKDGSIGFFDLPRLSQLGLFERYFRERYRKWAIDNLRSDSQKQHWPASARFVARQIHESTGGIPVEVSFWRHWILVPNPNEEFVRVGYRVSDERLEKFMFHKQTIREEDL
jgi:hypothetical protein